MTAHIAREDAVRIERIEAQAWLDHYGSAPQSTVLGLGLRVRDLDGIALLACDRVDSLLRNRVIGAGMLAQATPQRVQAILAHFAGSEQGFAINLSPFAEPSDTVARLQALGFQTFFHHLKWVRGAHPPAKLDTSVRVTRITAADAVRFVDTVQADGTTDPPAERAWSSSLVGRAGWTHLLAWDGDEPIGGATVFVNGDTAWLGQAHTRAEFRRRGAQQALIAERIRVAAEAGATLLTVDTAPDWPELPGESRRNVARAGFRVAYERQSYIRVS